MSEPKWIYPRNWRTLPAADRLAFRSKIDGDCLIWTGLCDKDGYGRIRINGGPNRRVSQVAWEIYNEAPPPDGLVVRHRCDNPPCFKREHLELGTIADNNRDRAERRRSCVGEDHHSARLTVSDVRDIRHILADGGSPTRVARQYGVHLNTVLKVRDRITWWWLP